MSVTPSVKGDLKKIGNLAQDVYEKYIKTAGIIWISDCGTLGLSHNLEI